MIYNSVKCRVLTLNILKQYECKMVALEFLKIIFFRLGQLTIVNISKYLYSLNAGRICIGRTFSYIMSRFSYEFVTGNAELQNNFLHSTNGIKA